MKNIEILYDVLKANPNFTDSDGNLLKNAIQEAALKMNPELLGLLIKNPETKSMFFSEVDEFLVFDKERFNWVIDSKDFLPSSYTGFKNKIMLTDEKGNSLKNNNDVVLSFPCKDCLLEMDSTKETDDRQEIFFNEVLMKKEIDTLLAPKVMASAKRYDESGVQETTTLSDKDNLIIKGNNLLAMHSLLPRYKGQIKLMYWDILYNTENDKVPYADSFKHSSWLVMMKNRLEVAKQLLREDGVICLQCDDNEQSYLTVLCDEVFGRNNRVNTLVVEMASTGGLKRSHKDKHFLKTKEYILIYSLSENIFLNCQYNIADTLDGHFNIWFDGKNLTSVKKVIDEQFPHLNIDSKFWLTHKDIKKFIISNANNIFQYHPAPTWTLDPKHIKETLYSDKDADVYRFTNIDNGSIEYCKTVNNKEKYGRMEPLEWNIEIINGEKEISVLRGDIWKNFHKDMGNVKKEGQANLTNGKKPERLIFDLISSFTSENDIVLDAYLGSGTTAAVAHKMGRQYIGIEQLDSHMDMAVKRLQGVIAGEQSGISKSVNWQGGGNFVYCELAKNSQNMIDKISSVPEADLSALYDEIKASDFICYRVDIDAMDKEKDGFEKLSEIEKRHYLISIIDKNTLYINYADMDDSDYSIDADIKKFNKNFYKEEK